MKTLSDMSSVNVAKKDNTYVFLSTRRFKFLDVRNYLAPDLRFDGWCKVNRCAMEKLVFPYEWLDDYGKLTFIRLVVYKAFYSSLKGSPTIVRNKYDKFI